jgi:hypothetical protein
MESNYEKLLKKKYPDPKIYDKEMDRIIDTLQYSVLYLEQLIQDYQYYISSLRKTINSNKKKLKELQ